MIQMKIYNCPNKEHRELFRRSGLLLLQELLPRKRKIKISLSFRKNLLTHGNQFGYCMANDSPQKRLCCDFAIRIDNTLTLNDKMHTLAHEFVHIKQYATGQLAHSNRYPDDWVWQKLRYNDSTTSYDEQPWEIEACALEDELLMKIKESGIWDGRS